MKAQIEKLKSLIAQVRPVKQSANASQMLLACDLGHSRVTLLEAQKTGNEYTILNFKSFSKPDGAEGMRAAIQEAGLTSPTVRISMKGQGVIVRFIQFPKMQLEELKAAMSYEAEKYIPFKASEVVTDFAVIDDASEGAKDAQMNILMVAVKREDVYGLIQNYQDYGLMVDVVDVDAVAAANALLYFVPEIAEQLTVLLDIGTEISTVCMIDKGKPRFIRDLSYGSMDIIKRLKRKIGIDEAEAIKILDGESKHAEAPDVIREGIDQLVTDLKVSIDYYLDQSMSSHAIAGLFLAGGAGGLPEVVDFFKQEMDFPVDTVKISENIKFSENVSKQDIEKNIHNLMVAFGLLLRDA